MSEPTPEAYPGSADEPTRQVTPPSAPNTPPPPPATAPPPVPPPAAPPAPPPAAPLSPAEQPTAPGLDPAPAPPTNLMPTTPPPAAPPPPAPAAAWSPPPSYPPAPGHPTPEYPTPGYAAGTASPYPPSPPPTPPDPAGTMPFPGGPAEPPKKAGSSRKVLITVVAVIAVLCLCCGGGVAAFAVFGDTIDTIDNASGPSTTPVPTNAETIGLFDDSPAAAYAEGEAGIVLPEARAVTGFTAAEVTEALQQVRTAMIAGRLDRKMLVQHDPSMLVNLLAEDTRSDIRRDFDTGDFFVYASQVAKTVTLSTETPRVSGTITYRSATDSGVRFLKVTTNFVWVYGFAGINDTDPLVVVHDEVNWEILTDKKVRKGSRGLWITQATAYASNIDCDLLDRSLLAPDTHPTVVDVADSIDDPDAVFDPDHTLDVGVSC